ncbi:P-loop containing nucleoside triphosphate hydrolase protein, partial [Linderina pennispora]
GLRPAKNKYSIDTAVFDALVDNASGLSVNDSEQKRSIASMLADTKDNELGSLVTLVSDRLAEGRGEAILEVNNDEGLAADLITVGLKRVVQDERVSALCQLLYDSRAATETPSSKARAATSHKAHTLSFLIRHKPANVEEMLEVRIAVAGNVDAGKSTMLGVLTQGSLDDGRGKARHEIESGRTSSSGRPIRHTNKHHKAGWDELISFLDLAGHEKYLKTTVFGMAGGAPDFVMLMVAANAGLTGMAKEHLGLALALNVPVFVVITKIDMCPPLILDSTLRQLTKVLRMRDHASFVNQRICPIFQISNVTGEGVDCLSTFLNAIGPNDEFRFEINETFSVPFVGTVVAGVVSSGKVSTGDSVWLGPDSLGHFRKRANSASFGFKKIKRSQVRKGMEPSASCTFEAEVVAMLHCGSVRQTARDNDTGTLRTGDRATFPEYLVPGARLIFREGRTKGVGKAEEQAVIHRITNGTMAKSEAIRHGKPLEHKVAAKGLAPLTLVPARLSFRHLQTFI